MSDCLVYLMTSLDTYNSDNVYQNTILVNFESEKQIFKGKKYITYSNPKDSKNNHWCTDDKYKKGDQSHRCDVQFIIRAWWDDSQHSWRCERDWRRWSTELYFHCRREGNIETDSPHMRYDRSETTNRSTIARYHGHQRSFLSRKTILDQAVQIITYGNYSISAQNALAKIIGAHIAITS